MGSFDHLALCVCFEHGKAPVHDRVVRGGVLESDVGCLGIREFNFSHGEPGAAQDHDVVVLDVLEVGKVPDCPQ